MADDAHEKALEAAARAAYGEHSAPIPWAELHYAAQAAWHRKARDTIEAYLAAADLVPRMPEIHEQARLINERDAMQAVVDAARAWRDEDEWGDTKGTRKLVKALAAHDKETGFDA